MSEHDSIQETEEILLSRPEDRVFPDESETLNNVSVKFSQTNRAHLESKKFRIYDNQFLQIISFKNNIQQQYWLNLAYINNRVDRKFIMNKLWLWLCLALLGLAGLVFYAAIPVSIAVYSEYKNPLAILSATLACMSLLTLFAKARSVVYLRSLNGAAPMVEIFYNNPNKAAYNGFLQQLADSIQSAKANNDMDSTQQLAAELKDHRRLRDQGILSHENYDKAKEIIFSLHSHSSVGEKMLPY